jgi:hypothetical protein
MYCTQCGKILSHADKFCSKCGAEVIEEVSVGPSVSPDIEKISIDLSPTVDKDILRLFAKRIAISIWWKWNIALLALGLFSLVFMTSDTSGDETVPMLILFSFIYIIVTIWVPFQTLKSITGKPAVGISKDKISANTSIEVQPTPATTANYVALTWGFLWRQAIVSVLVALPLKLSDYSPEEIELTIVSSVLLLLTSWVASQWLVSVPLGKCRFILITTNSNTNDAT